MLQPLDIYVVTRGRTLTCMALSAYLDRATALRISDEKNNRAALSEPSIIYGSHRISLFLKNALLFEVLPPELVDAIAQIGQAEFVNNYLDKRWLLFPINNSSDA